MRARAKPLAFTRKVGTGLADYTLERLGEGSQPIITNDREQMHAFFEGCQQLHQQGRLTTQVIVKLDEYLKQYREKDDSDRSGKVENYLNMHGQYCSSAMRRQKSHPFLAKMATARASAAAPVADASPIASFLSITPAYQVENNDVSGIGLRPGRQS
jgi:hypothetical protein